MGCDLTRLWYLNQRCLFRQVGGGEYWRITCGYVLFVNMQTQLSNFWKKIIGTVLYAGLAGVGFYFLYTSKTDRTLDAPWQTIHPYYIYVFFGATVVLGLMIWFIGHRYVGYIIFLCIIHSLLLHSYLPFTHSLLYGADQWRHMANEIRFLHGESFLKPMLTSQPQSFVQTLDPGLISYAQLWGITLFFAYFFSVDLLALNIWLVPIVWSIACPVLLYKIGGAFGWGKRKSLFFVFLGFLPFTWSVGGSLTLPNSLGFLWFLMVYLLVLKRCANSTSRRFLYFLGGGVIVALCGYVLYAFLAILLWICTELLLHTQQVSVPKKKIIDYCIVIFGAAAIPVSELAAGYSTFSIHHPWLAEFKQMVGNFTALYLAAGPRPHDIDRGNIIFNQVPANAFVSNLFTYNRWWLVCFMIVFLVLVVRGVVYGFKHREQVTYYLAACMTTIVTGSYVIGRYVLEGQQILSRRLEHVVAFFWMISFMIGVECIWRVLRTRKICSSSVVVCVGIVLVSKAIVASYSLGPDLRAISVAEYEAMKYISSQEYNNTEHCVVADTYPLLALEFLSHKKIIGGGFPIDQHFDQPIKESILQELKNNPREEVWQNALDVTKTNTCWLVVPKDVFRSNIFSKERERDMMMFGNSVVWKYMYPSQLIKIK